MGEDDVLAFNAKYGVAGEGSMAGTWRRPTIHGHGAGENRAVADHPPYPVDCPRGRALQSFPLKEISSQDFDGGAKIEMRAKC